MSTQKLFISLSQLQQSQLEACYHDANQEIDPSLEATASDGLEENETW